MGQALRQATSAARLQGKHINDLLGINTLKHFDRGDDDSISPDIDECAIGAIVKAMANLKQLGVETPPYAMAMLGWIYKNKDHKTIMAAYEERGKKFDQRTKGKE